MLKLVFFFCVLILRKMEGYNVNNIQLKVCGRNVIFRDLLGLIQNVIEWIKNFKKCIYFQMESYKKDSDGKIKLLRYVLESWKQCLFCVVVNFFYNKFIF